MGFSLSRALAGAVVGGAHAAGDVFSDQLAEAAKDRARVADEERAFRVAEHADELLAAREQSKRDYLETKQKDALKQDADTMREVREAVREQGLDPDTPAGMKAAAGIADEKGYLNHADKFRIRAETERANTAREEGLKEARAARAEAAAARRGAKMDEEEKNRMQQLDRVIGQFKFPVYKQDEDGKLKHVGDDDSGAAAAASYAYGRRDDNESFKSINRDLRQIQEQASIFRQKDPTLSGNVAFELGKKVWENKGKAPDATANAGPSAQPAAPVAQPKKRIPGAFEGMADQAAAAWQSGMTFP